MPALSREDSVVDEATRDGVVESNVEELKILAGEIESTDVYAIKPETLVRWAVKLRTAAEIVQHHPATSVASSPRAKSPSRAPQPTSFAAATAGGVGAPFRRRESVSVADPAFTTPSTVAGHVASTVHFLLDVLCCVTRAEWCTCYLYSEATKKLVLAGGAGKRQSRPGEVKLVATSGVESLVMENGVAVSMGIASAEKEYDSAQDLAFGDHTRGVLIFPMHKPGSTSCTIGVLEVGSGGRTTFSADDEAAVADCAFFLANLLVRYPNDAVTPAALDPSIFNKPLLPDVKSGTSLRRPQLVFRTSHHAPPKRGELLRDAAAVSKSATITDALDSIAQVTEAWRSAVLLNIELEHEIRRLHEALRISRRETARLQELVGSK